MFRLQATAWLALTNGEFDRAVQLMRSAVELEEQTDKSSISPGRVLPAHEQLGDILAALDRPQEALVAYEESMTRAPRRFNTYVGAARAAMAAGETAVPTTIIRSSWSWPRTRAHALSWRKQGTRPCRRLPAADDRSV